MMYPAGAHIISIPVSARSLTPVENPIITPNGEDQARLGVVPEGDELAGDAGGRVTKVRQFQIGAYIAGAHQITFYNQNMDGEENGSRRCSAEEENGYEAH